MVIVILMSMEVISNHAAVIVLFHWAHWTCSLVTLCIHGPGFPYRGDGSKMSVHANHAIMHTPGQSSDVTVITTIDYYQIWLRKAMSTQPTPSQLPPHLPKNEGTPNCMPCIGKEYFLCLWGGSKALKNQSYSKTETVKRVGANIKKT